MKKKLQYLLALGFMGLATSSASAAGIADVTDELEAHATAILALSGVALAITGAYIVIHHVKKGARAAGS